jgi:hypothetical protein
MLSIQTIIIIWLLKAIISIILKYLRFKIIIKKRTKMLNFSQLELINNLQIQISLKIMLIKYNKIYKIHLIQKIQIKIKI